MGFDFKSDIIKEDTKTNSNEENLLNLIGSVRDKLRADKNFGLSDFIRDELAKLNVTIKDKKL